MLQRVPLWEALQAHISKGGYSFHVPGHKQGRGLPEEFTRELIKADLTELPGLDNLYNPEDALLEAEQMASSFAGSAFCHFTTNGASSALIASILAVSGVTNRVLLPRNAHISCVHACVLGDLTPVFVDVRVDTAHGVVLGVDEEDFASKLSTGVGAAVLVNPTYQGVCGDIAGLGLQCANAGVPLIVDEAHGSHFMLGGALPPSGLAADAALVVHSVHKTGLALTGAAWVHGMDISYSEPVKRSLRLLQSTSPSYLLLASLDLSRWVMQVEGPTRLIRALGVADAIGQNVNTYKAPAGYRQDPLRIVVDAGSYGLTGYELEQRLRLAGVFCEMADINNVTLVLSLADGEESKQHALSGLETALKDGGLRGSTKVSLAWPPLGVQYLTPREAHFAVAEWRPLVKSVGRIAVDSVAVYPPGVPIIWPGQRIETHHIEYIQCVQERGAVVTGLKQSCIKVVK